MRISFVPWPLAMVVVTGYADPIPEQKPRPNVTQKITPTMTVTLFPIRP